MGPLLFYFFLSVANATSLNRSVVNEISHLNRIGKACPPQVINGVGAITPSGEEYFKPVVEIKLGDSTCSASYVGPGVLLTAAHCMEALIKRSTRSGRRGRIFQSRPGKLELNGKEVAYKKILTPSRGVEGANDLALIQLETEQERGNHYVIGINSAPPTNAGVTLVGFSKVLEFVPNFSFPGNVEQNAWSLEGKKWGRNRVHSRNADYVVIDSPLADDLVKDGMESTGNRAGLGFGDSGGPLIYHRRIVGIASALELNTGRIENGAFNSKFDYFLDLSRAGPRAFLREAVKLGIPVQIED